MRSYAARAAVRADHGPREQRLAALEDDGDGAPVRHRRAVLFDALDGDAGAHLGARLLRVLDELLVELGPVDQPEQHLLGATGAGEAAVVRERHGVHPVPEGQLEAGRERVPGGADDAAPARLVARQLGLLQDQHAPPGDRRRVRGRGPRRSRTHHDDVPHLLHVVRRRVLAAHDGLLLPIKPPPAAVPPHPTAGIVAGRCGRITALTRITSHPQGACPCRRIRSPRPSPR